MTKTRYNRIYMALREKMEDEAYGFQELLPSENTLVKEFDHSRGTIRRAIGQLASGGYVQSIHGKEVRVIYQSGQQQSEFILGGMKSLKEAVAKNRRNYITGVVCFAELTVDETIQRRTTFPMGAQIYYIQHMCCIEGEALVVDHNHFLKNVVRDLTPRITERSIYEYMEKDLDKSIVTTKRKITVERVNQIDETHLDLRDYNCVAVMSSMTYSKEGVMFEFTQSRYRPDRFVFYDLTHRTKQVNQDIGEQGASDKCSSGVFQVQNMRNTGKSQNHY